MILVTGGAGFIGSAVIAELNARGYDDIFIVDILGKDERWKNLRHLRYSDYMESDDFSQMVSDSEVELDVDAIIHLGACSDTTERDCSYLVRNNYEFSKLLAGWALEIGARFIYASSAATYGDGSQGFLDDEEELQSLVPLNMYGYSKHMFDLWCKRQGLLDKFVGLNTSTSSVPMNIIRVRCEASFSRRLSRLTPPEGSASSSLIAVSIRTEASFAILFTSATRWR
jgi:ADP-L-glycero-D-manno-heptose 6-epimerase